MYCMAMTYHNSNLSFDFKKENSDKVYTPILKEKDVYVHMVIPNSSPYFKKDDEDIAPLRIDAAGHTFDMDQVDNSVAILVTQKFLKLHLKQDVVIELFNMLQHNVMNKDAYSVEFKAALKPRKAVVTRA